MTSKLCAVAVFAFLSCFSLQSAHASAGSKEHPPAPAAAPPVSLTDEKWHKCESDDQCVLVYKCDDDAVNKNVLGQYQTLAATTSCPTTLRHNPHAVAHCVHNNCAALNDVHHPPGAP